MFKNYLFCVATIETRLYLFLSYSSLRVANMVRPLKHSNFINTPKKKPKAIKLR